MNARVILITGGTGKVGRALVAHFLSLGDTVVTTGRSEESLAALRACVPGERGDLIGIVADFTAEDAISDFQSRLTKLNIFPDGLVNNARNVDFLRSSNGKVSRNDFLSEYLLDVVVPYELTMALAQHPDRCLRQVVNIGSQYGMVAANPRLYDDHNTESPIHYSVAKAALVHLTRELAVRLANHDVQVNCVAFGGVKGRTNSAFEQRYGTLVPLRRMLRENELAGPVDYLLSEGCSGMTGQTLQVDGGWTLW